MILTFLGAPRTGTNSFFYAVKNHKEIAVSKNKEPFNESIYRHIFPRKYIDEFKITDETKVLLDGTPCAYFYVYDIIKNIQKTYGFDIKIVYPVRNPFDRIYSNIKQNIVCNGNISYIQNKNETLDASRILECMDYMKDSILLKYAYKITDDIFIFRFDEFKFYDVLKFMGVEGIDGKIDRLNSMDVFYSHKFHEAKKQLDFYWTLYLKKIAKIILNDLHIIKDKVYVEDWIEQAENILSNV